MGSRCARGPCWGPGDSGAQGGFGHGPVGEKNEGDWSGLPGRREEASRLSGPGDPGGPLGPGPLGDNGFDRNSARALSAAAGSRRLREQRAHTRAHTPQEHAQCGPVNFLPSSEQPWPPAPKVGGWGFVSGDHCARPSPFCAPGPCLSFAGRRVLLSPTIPAAGHWGVDVIPYPAAVWPEAWWRGCLPGGSSRNAPLARTDQACKQAR